jgi:two-component system, cell cycle sensor histidine kinase and response regulator CckA
MRILLVEDNPADANLTQIYLRERPAHIQEEIQVEHVETLAAALELLAQASSFTVALVDLTLPDSFGMATFDALRTRDANLPMVLVTGIDDERLAEQSLQHGAQDYLVKGSFSARLLWRAIRFAIIRGSWLAATGKIGLVNTRLQRVIESLGSLAESVAQLNQSMIPRSL